MAPQKKGPRKAPKSRGKISPAHRRALDKVKILDAVVDLIAEIGRKNLEIETSHLKRENKRLEEANTALSAQLLSIEVEKA